MDLNLHKQKSVISQEKGAFAMSQEAKARCFKKLHQPGNPLVLFNVWDAGSAKVIADEGAKAIATGSWSVAAAHGYPDGQEIPLDLVLRLTDRLCRSVTVPVSLDFEAGYAHDPLTVADHVERLIDVGVVGINFEDQIIGGDALYDLEDQVARIAAIRVMADRKQMPFFINARTDLFLFEKDPAHHPSLLKDAIKRAKAYEEAGADGFFAPGLATPNLIRELCQSVDLPVNILFRSGVPAISELAGLGVARVSFGPQPYRQTMTALAHQFRVDLGIQ